ncbi:hypothetical protein M595_5146 [Lyngbya aestuarii BL J]|uniref:Uncharacterized protein n=1 Tax=Lyngbya aestuarii BL J TaxID=1348334 RepID=U7QD44_9CYAN|nr:hypothetical protein M595_5146 [Lyngbya aestuarii BL J]
MPSSKSIFRKKKKKVPWFEQLMALLALINFILVLFNLTYIPLRNFYFRYTPKLTQLYDPIKGIEPQRQTEDYIKTVEQLQQQALEFGLNSSEVNQTLNTLQTQSINLINEDPFAVANKSGTLEKIKNEIREKVPSSQDSAKEAFQIFWSTAYLTQQGFQEELEWFDEEIIPQMEVNYYRQIDENGQFIDEFWKIDLPFILIFLVEFLLRTYLVARRFVSFTWFDAMLWRWYDILLFIPYWRWLRIIPVTIRLEQVGWIDIERVRMQAIRGVLTSFAHELTEIVVIQAINQFQNDIENGDFLKQFFESQNRRYIDLNDINEIEVLATRLVQITVYKAIPKVQPEIEAILRYSLQSAVQQSPLSTQLKQIPGLQDLPTQITERLINELSKLAVEGPQSTYEAVKTAMEDPVGTRLSNELVRHFGAALGQEIQKEQSIHEIETLLVAFLEEFKINYVQRVDEENFEQVISEARQLRQLTKGK